MRRRVRGVVIGDTACLCVSIVPAGPAPAALTAIFAVVCTFSHRLPDDPIVHPRQPGTSHSHDFFGNTTTDASSTYASLRAGSTTCHNPEDTAAYWVPTLLVGTAAVAPSGLHV